MRAAAERAGCESVLALAEVKETWDALPSGDDQRDYYDDYDEDEDEDERRERGPHRLPAQRPDRRRDHPRLVDQPGRHRRRADLAACPRLRGVRHHPERGPGALPVRVRGLHGQLRQHAGSVVPAGRGCRVAAGPSVRGARRGRIAVGAPPAPRPHRGRRPGWRTCRGGVARAVLEKGRGTAGAARRGPGGGGGPGRSRDGSDAAGAVPYRDGRAGACGRAGGGGRAVRRRMDAERRRRVVRAGAPLRNRAVRVGRQQAVRGCAGRCVPPGSRRWRGCWSPEPGAGWTASSDSGPPTREPRSAGHSWRC